MRSPRQPNASPDRGRAASAHLAPWRPVLACTFTIALLALFGCGSAEEQQAKPVVQVKVAKAETGTVHLSVNAPAAIFPCEQASIAARITAPIRTIRVKKGQAVDAGQVLAELENRDLLAQRQEADAAVADARANLGKVSSGTLPADIERARGQLAIAEATLNQTRTIYEKRQQLFKAGAIPGRELLATETDFAKAKADYQVAKQSLDLLQNQSRDRDISMAKSRLAQAQAHLANAAAQLQFTEIRSPFAGVVTEQLMYPGDMAKPDAPMLAVMDLSAVVARAQVPEGQVGAIRKDQPCVFTPADSPGASFHGIVSVVSGVVDPARRTVEIWCGIPNPKRALRANEYGNVAIRTGNEPGSIIVPQPAVQFVEGASKGAVLVVDEKRTAHKRDVETGQVFDGKVQIKSGVKPGELVVVEGGYGLPDGAEVRW